MNANQLQQQAPQHFQRGEYSEAVKWAEANFEESARQSNSHLSSNYWYLGWALLLVGEEAEGRRYGFQFWRGQMSKKAIATSPS